MEEDNSLVDFNSFHLFRKIGEIDSWLIVDIPPELKRKSSEAYKWAEEQWPEWEVANVNSQKEWLFVNNEHTRDE